MNEYPCIRNAVRQPISTGPIVREITRRCATTRVERVDIRPEGERGALMGVLWADGSYVWLNWANAKVCEDWVAEHAWANNKVFHARPYPF